ncbi:class I adenylate-forming enzyme family protein [Bradyrhizobium murdochi]|uniref:class I adenylate-forming enzyme family protein n=1 Tax=Bradyrhizobium murdochi TaxID=1038859 RepID=UPI00040C57D1|nr:class I adenylate-forming enzyme family protein [Bradyrhizobium murdochi]
MPESSAGQLQERVAAALRKREVLEAELAVELETFTLGKFVSSRAGTHGTKTAIDIFERGERATYSEMDTESNRYAHALRALGVRKGDRVGVLLPNRIEYPIIWFAIAKLGAIMVPINARYTSREIEYVLSDTQAQFAVVDESAWQTFSAMDPWPTDLTREKVILVGEAPSQAFVARLDSLLKQADNSPLEEDIGPKDILNIAFTSGTTGFPKGCMLTHEYICLSSAFVCLDLEKYERYLSWAPFYYAEGQGPLLRSYRQGGTLYMAEKLSSTRFHDWMKKYRIEWCPIPETLGRDPVIAAAASTQVKEILQYGGWGSESIRQFRDQSGVPGHNAYGMTEIGWVTRLPADIPEMDRSDSTGLRSFFKELRLMNEDGSPTFIGEVGELWVRGRALFKGYWNKPEVNAAQFEGEWFKTGDLMRRDELGFYWIVGRKKEMIRRSGENIAAREVEAVIRDLPEVADVAAVPVPDTKRGEEVKIYVELKQGVSGDEQLVRRILQHARSRLAIFKVPRYVSFIPALPRTASSEKVLKGELMSISDPIAESFDAEENRWH